MVTGSALAFALIVARGSVALFSHQTLQEPQNAALATPGPPVAATFTGVITDSSCGARHLRNSNLSPADCTRECVRKGAKYILVDGDRRYNLTGADDVLALLAGTRANVIGIRDGGSIAVSSAAPVF